jgi:HEPN domain-containing protein
MDRRLELAQILLRRANDDLSMARRLAGDTASPEWGIGSHVQQAVEKALKAVLCSYGTEYPRTHSISILLDLLAERASEIPVPREALVVLTPYGVLFRYDEAGPSDVEMANLPDRASMLGVAERVISWAGMAGLRKEP